MTAEKKTTTHRWINKLSTLQSMNKLIRKYFEKKILKANMPYNGCHYDIISNSKELILSLIPCLGGEFFLELTDLTWNKDFILFF